MFNKKLTEYRLSKADDSGKRLCMGYRQTARVSSGDLCRRQKRRPSRQARPQCAVLPFQISLNTADAVGARETEMGSSSEAVPTTSCCHRSYRR